MQENHDEVMNRIKTSVIQEVFENLVIRTGLERQEIVDIIQDYVDKDPGRGIR